MRLIGIIELLFAVVAELSAVGLTIAYGSLDYVYKGTTTCNIVVRLCPLVSAYVRVLTFRRIILTIRLLHLAACSHYTWFILMNISYLCNISEERRVKNLIDLFH